MRIADLRLSVCGRGGTYIKQITLTDLDSEDPRVARLFELATSSSVALSLPACAEVGSLVGQLEVAKDDSPLMLSTPSVAEAVRVDTELPPEPGETVDTSDYTGGPVGGYTEVQLRFLSDRVSDLGFSSRAVRGLSGKGIEFGWQLISRPAIGAKEIKYFGKESRNEVNELVRDRKLQYSTQLPPEVMAAVEALIARQKR